VKFDDLLKLPIVAVWDSQKEQVNFAGFTHQDGDGQQCGVWFGPTRSTASRKLELRKFCPSWTDKKNVEVFSWKAKPNHELTWAHWSKDSELLPVDSRFHFDTDRHCIPVKSPAEINAAVRAKRDHAEPARSAAERQVNK